MLENITLKLINIYQAYIRLILPSSCRFQPTCSEYSRQAIMQYGLARGALKGMRRLLRCHPFSGQAGYDPLK